MPRSDISFPLKDAELREDVHMLGALVGEVIREQGGDALFEAVEQDRQAAIARRDGSAEGARELATRTRDVPAAQARDLVRAFSLWFEMVNMAEKVHRIRRRRQYLNEGTTQPSGIVEAVTRLKEQGLALDEIRRLMIEIWIEPVFTAHPTESTRRTILRKQQKIAQLLLGRLGLSRTAAETRQIWDRDPRRDHRQLADSGELARAAQRGRRARARAVLHRGDPVPDRADLLRGDRSGAGAGLRRRGACTRAARDPALRLVGRRRHGRQSGREREDDPRNVRAASAASSSTATFSSARVSRRRCRRARRAWASRTRCRHASSST